jgi:threonine/homoserine/homoserine lactone efflux protein
VQLTVSTALRRGAARGMSAAAGILAGNAAYLVLSAERVRRSSLAHRAALWIERAGGAILVAIAVRIAREPLVAAP